MIFFTDENVSEFAARILALVDRTHEVRWHGNHFERGTPDQDWLREIAKWEGKPVVIAGDGRILRSPVLKHVLRESDLMFVCLSKGWMNLSWPEQAWRYVKAWPDIIRAVSQVRRPTIFEVSATSLKVQQMYATSELR